MFDWLFGKGRDAYEQEQRQALDKAYTDKFVADFVSQKMGGMRDKFKGSIDDNQWGDAMDSIKSVAQRNSDTYNDTQKQFDETMKKQRHNYFGDGLLGSILNPIAQTGTAALDLATGNYKDRDVMSDIGAAGQTLLGALPAVGGAAKALNMGKAASGLGKINNALTTIPGSIGTGAVFGGLETLQQDGADTNLGDVLNSAGTGAAFGAALPMVSNFVKTRGAKNLVTKYMSDPRYSQASEALQNAGREEIGNFVKRVAKSGSPGLQEIYGGLYKNALPQSTFGKLALGGGALYGGSRLLGGGQQQPQTIEDYYAMQQGGYY